MLVWDLLYFMDNSNASKTQFIVGKGHSHFEESKESFLVLGNNALARSEKYVAGSRLKLH